MTTQQQESMSSGISVDVQTTTPTVNILTARSASVARSHLSGPVIVEDREWELRPLTDKTLKTAHIHCRVCNKPATVPIDHPALLCGLCLENLDATRAHVAACVEAVLVRLDQAKAEWTGVLDFSPAKERWEKVQAAMIGVAEGRVSKDVLARTWAKRRAEGGPLATLLLAYERYARDTDQCAAEFDKWAIAQEEINAAWMAKEI